MSPSPLDSLPPPASGDDFARARALVAASRTKLVVLDDDPTGTQTLHGVDVLADFSVSTLAAALADPRPCFFVLTNTRSLPASEAASLVGTVASRLATAGAQAGADFVVASRSDSTLRGHFIEELDALERGLGRPIDAKVVIPAFFEGGRYTVDNVHYVADGDRLVPAGETEFARDATFGYRHSRLPEWIEEKTSGRVLAADVAAIDLATLRGARGADAVREQLLSLPRGAFVVVNAAAYSDLEVFVHGLLQAESAGRRFLFRTAASFVRVRAGILPQPLLVPADIRNATPGGGLIVVGSFIRKTTQQLEALLRVAGTSGIEVVVDRLAEAGGRAEETRRVSAEAVRAMSAGRHAVIFTSRSHETVLGKAGDLTAGRVVSAALVDIVQSISVRPAFLIAKGGITASDVATAGLGMRRALVLGQAAPECPSGAWAPRPVSPA